MHYHYYYYWERYGKFVIFNCYSFSIKSFNWCDDWQAAVVSRLTEFIIPYIQNKIISPFFSSFLLTFIQLWPVLRYFRSHYIPVQDAPLVFLFFWKGGGGITLIFRQFPVSFQPVSRQFPVSFSLFPSYGTQKYTGLSRNNFNSSLSVNKFKLIVTVVVKIS